MPSEQADESSNEVDRPRYIPWVPVAAVASLLLLITAIVRRVVAGELGWPALTDWPIILLAAVVLNVLMTQITKRIRGWWRTR